MSMNLDIDCEQDYLRVRVTGEFSLPEANDCVVAIFEAIAQDGVQKVLVDCRQLKGEPTTMERFVHATFAVREMERFSTAGVFRGTRFAYVGNEPLIDRSRFGETVAVNRGLNVKVSLSLEGALQWLKIEPADAASTDRL
jgi:hypothetical protein